MEIINDKQIDRFCKSLEKDGIKRLGYSLTWVSLGMACSPFIIEVRDGNTCFMKEGWREAIRAKQLECEQRVMSSTK
jgi:hypothetical protein